MEKHVFIANQEGEFTHENGKYNARCVSKKDAIEMVTDGWSYSLESAMLDAKPKPRKKAVINDDTN